MPSRTLLRALSSRAPTIVIATLLAALVGYWFEVPVWLPYGLAIVVAIIALMVMASRDRRARPRVDDDVEGSGSSSWIAHEIAGRGSPSGSYLLGFFSLVTIVLTGFQGAYALPAWAALALSAAWGIANARYPAGEELEH
jgi:hypothetical protein